MEDVIVARAFKTPIGEADINGALAKNSWCFDLHRTLYRWSYFSSAGTRLICRFSAPDAESVRLALQASPSRPDYTHSVSLHAPPDAGTTDAPPEFGPDSLIVVERNFDSEVDFAVVEAIKDKGQWCLDQHRVRHLRSYFARDRRRMVCLYRAPDAEAVRQVQDRIGLPYEKAWPAVVFMAPAKP
jgi:hypothetical protein